MSGNFITMFVTHISHNYVASKINIKEEYEQGKINIFLGHGTEVLVNNRGSYFY